MGVLGKTTPSCQEAAPYSRAVCLKGRRPQLLAGERLRFTTRRIRVTALRATPRPGRQRPAGDGPPSPSQGRPRRGPRPPRPRPHPVRPSPGGGHAPRDGEGHPRRPPRAAPPHPVRSGCHGKGRRRRGPGRGRAPARRRTQGWPSWSPTSGAVDSRDGAKRIGAGPRPCASRPGSGRGKCQSANGLRSGGTSGQLRYL